MTMKEASERYKIPAEILQEYEDWGLKKVMGAWQYDEQDIQKISMLMTLHDIGFSANEAQTYMRLALEGVNTQPQRTAMLDKIRKKTLDEIHFKEKQIACMDYLRHEMRQTAESHRGGRTDA